MLQVQVRSPCCPRRVGSLQHMHIQLPCALAPRLCTPRSSHSSRSLLTALLTARVSLRSSSNLARCKWNHRAARAWASCPTWCATSDGGGRPSINFSEVCSPPAQPTTVPAVALGAAGSRAASGTHVHPSCRVQLMAALASSTFATVELLRESAALSGKQPRRAGFWRT